MSGIGDFVQNMTFWNWLTLIAFIFLPLSALNAFLSLKSRYSNWRGIQTKKKFEKRLEALKAQWTEVENYNKNLSKFFLHILNSLPLGLTFTSLGFFFFAFSLYRFPTSEFSTSVVNIMRVVEVLYEILAVLAMGIIVNSMINLKLLIYSVHKPYTLAKEIIDFIYAGRQKGFIVGEEEFILSLIKNKIFTDDERVRLFNHSFDLDRSSDNKYGLKAVHRDNDKG